MTEKSGRHCFPHYKSMGPFSCQRNQSVELTCLKPTCRQPPTKTMLHMKFGWDWLTDVRNILVTKYERRRCTADQGYTISPPFEPLAQVSLKKKKPPYLLPIYPCRLASVSLWGNHHLLHLLVNLRILPIRCLVPDLQLQQHDPQPTRENKTSYIEPDLSWTTSYCKYLLQIKHWPKEQILWSLRAMDNGDWLWSHLLVKDHFWETEMDLLVTTGATFTR